MTKTLELSKRDSEIFAEAMLDPSEPNEALREAARVYKERVGDEKIERVRRRLFREYTEAWDELGAQ